MPLKEEEENKTRYLSWWIHRVERASLRSRLKCAWWKEAEEFEVVLLTSVFLCSILVLLNLLLCWGWTRGDYYKGIWLQRDLHSMRVGTWDSFTHEKEGVWVFGGLVSNAKFQCLGMSWGYCDNGLKERQRMGWRRGRERQLCKGEREFFLIIWKFTQTYQKQWAGYEIF